MKRLIILLFIICGFSPLIWAVDGCNQERLSPEEFRAKQKAFIIEKAGLTKEEAAKFFPVYFELQDKKKALNDKAWGLIRKGKDDKTTEAQYAEIMEGVYDARIASDQLERTYYEKYKKILSNKKIYMVQKAEMRFHKELLKKAKKYCANMPISCAMFPQDNWHIDTLPNWHIIYHNPFFFASFQIASISSNDMSLRFFPSLMVCSSR